MIQPICDRVVIKPLDTEEVRSRGGIIIPDIAKTDRAYLRRGLVVAVGEHTECPGCGYRAWPLEAKVGQVALYTNKHLGKEFIDEAGQKYLILREVDIYAVEV